MAISQRDSDLTAPKALHGPPAGYFVLLPQQNAEDSLGVTRILAALAGSWKLLLLAAVLGAIAAGAYSFTKPKTYRARMVLAPVSSEEGVGSGGGLSSELGGIAAMAGVDVTGDAARREQSFAALTSDGFARDFIEQENLMPVLFAKRWDARSGRWLPGKPPTLEAGVRKFKHEVVFAKQDQRTSLVTVTVEWYSPTLAATWADRMVQFLNSRLRAEATSDAERSIEYLNAQLTQGNPTVELHQAISRLIEQQVNRAMVANVKRDYAYRYIDPPVAPDVRFGPQRFLYALVGAVVGVVLAWLYVYAYRDRRKARARP